MYKLVKNYNPPPRNEYVCSHFWLVLYVLHRAYYMEWHDIGFCLSCLVRERRGCVSVHQRLLPPVTWAFLSCPPNTLLMWVAYLQGSLFHYFLFSPTLLYQIRCLELSGQTDRVHRSEKVVRRPHNFIAYNSILIIYEEIALNMKMIEALIVNIVIWINVSG